MVAPEPSERPKLSWTLRMLGGSLAFLMFSYPLVAVMALLGDNIVPPAISRPIAVLLVLVPTFLAVLGTVLNFQSRFLKYLALFLLGVISLIFGILLLSHDTLTSTPPP